MDQSNSVLNITLTKHDSRFETKSKEYKPEYLNIEKYK